jgi:hypothetical protein
MRQQRKKYQLTLQQVEKNLEGVNIATGNFGDTNTSNDIFVFVCTFVGKNCDTWG